MKRFSLFVLITVLIISCSAPKYNYYFSYHKYQPRVENEEITMPSIQPIPSRSLIASADPDLKPPLFNPNPMLKGIEREAVVQLYKNEAIKDKLDEMGDKYEQVFEGTVDLKKDKAVKKEFKRDLKELRKEIKKEVKKNPEDYKALTDKKAGGKSQLVALLLILLLSGFAAHRFYLGYIGIGIIQLLLFWIGLITSPFIVGWPLLAAWFVWWVIDLIRIIDGSLGPKNGSYESTL